jgi:gas vesicle protein
MNNNAKVFLAAVAGAALGVIAGILIAPASGKETLDDISKKANDLKGDLDDLAKKSKKSLEEISENLVANIQTTINGLKKDAKETKS